MNSCRRRELLANAANRSLARKANIALKNLVGVAADPYVRTVAVERLVALRCSLTLWLVPVVASVRQALT